jgi:hypothetical protein
VNGSNCLGAKQRLGRGLGGRERATVRALGAGLREVGQINVTVSNVSVSASYLEVLVVESMAVRVGSAALSRTGNTDGHGLTWRSALSAGVPAGGAGDAAVLPGRPARHEIPAAELNATSL